MPYCHPDNQAFAEDEANTQFPPFLLTRYELCDEVSFAASVPRFMDVSADGSSAAQDLLG